jgi:predicted thioesterase
MDLAPGATHEITRMVTPDLTADALGNPGVHVFATPMVVALMESVSAAMIHPTLPSGVSTVGTMVEMRHLAATPAGMQVRAKATLVETDGRRFLFSVDVWDAKEKVAEGRHERHVIPDLQRFLARVMRKGQG